MNESQVLALHSESDIIAARLLVRRLARARGFDIADQARISLASSSLAYSLGLGGIVNEGQIAIECLSDGARTGIRVVYTKASSAMFDLALEAFEEMRFMVDELSVERLPGDDLRVTLLKWMGDDGGRA
jgi:hypothetical protein